MNRLKLRDKLVVSVGLLILLAVLILTSLSYISLHLAYQRTAEAKREKLDQLIQSQVECLIGVLEANYARFENGELTDAQARENAAYIVRTTRYNQGTGYFWADMADGVNAVHINPDIEGTNRYNTQDEKGNYFVQDTIAAGDKPDGGFIDFYFTKPGENQAKAKRGFIRKFAPYGWYIGTGNYQEDMLPLIQAELDSSSRALTLSTIVMFSCGAIVLIVAVMIMGVIAKKISQPISNATDRIQKLSEGNLHDPVMVTDSADEVGILTKSLADTVRSLRAYIENISYVLCEFDSGNMNVKIDLDYVGDFAPIKSSLLRTVEVLNNTFTRVRFSAEQVSTSSDQVSSAAQSLSQGATEQASSVEELAGTISDISQRVSQNAESAEEASKKCQETSDELIVGKERMSGMVEAMRKITSTSEEIGKIVKTIDDIAFQTNILALNAAVEAARAGVAGKGFAVVADEVRNLAGKSSEASKNTSSLIKTVVEMIQGGGKIAEDTAQSLDSIVTLSEAASNLVYKISSASKEQAEAISQVTIGIDQISSVVQTNSATAEESAAASEELFSQAQEMKRLLQQFKLKAPVYSS